LLTSLIVNVVNYQHNKLYMLFTTMSSPNKLKNLVYINKLLDKELRLLYNP